MMTNPWTRWGALEPKPILMVGEVLELTEDGASLVEIIGGGVVRAAGTSVPVGHRAFVRGGEIEGEAPELALAQMEI